MNIIQERVSPKPSKRKDISIYQKHERALKDALFTCCDIMKNPMIYATGNETIRGENNISYYIFEKDVSFLNWLAKLLVEVFEITDGEQKAKLIIKENEDEKGRKLEDEVYYKEIAKMIDVHEYYANKGQRVDIFYGKERIYVTLRKSKEIRKKFAKFVLKTKDWIKIKHARTLPVYVTKRTHEKVLKTN